MPTFFKIISKKCLGIDIGTSFVKLVELSSSGQKRKLENYGEVSAEIFYQKPFRTFERNILLLSSKDISQAIKGILDEAKIKTRRCIFSIPDFSSFFTNFELPPMTKEEIPQAVRFEARQHVPLPLSEVTLDWQIIEGTPSDREKTKLKILLVTVPNEVINQYQEIAKLSGLQLISLEAEIFGLIRSLIPPNEERVISLIDIGAKSTTCSIIDRRVLKVSHSFDLGGNELTERIATSLGVDYQTAENFKKKYGISTLKGNFEVGSSIISLSLKEILLPLIDLILKEVENVFRNFYQLEGKKVQKIILAGGTSLLPGLKEYFQESLKREVEIANPFSYLSFPPILEKTLKEMGPGYAIAVGMALAGL